MPPPAPSDTRHTLQAEIRGLHRCLTVTGHWVQVPYMQTLHVPSAAELHELPQEREPRSALRRHGTRAGGWGRLGPTWRQQGGPGKTPQEPLLPAQEAGGRRLLPSASGASTDALARVHPEHGPRKVGRAPRVSAMPLAPPWSKYWKLNNRGVKAGEMGCPLWGGCPAAHSEKTGMRWLQLKRL